MAENIQAIGDKDGRVMGDGAWSMDNIKKLLL